MTSCEDFHHRNIFQEIVGSIQTFWEEHENEDFQVNIEGACIKCHSFILASCSEFFRSLFRSHMKEKREMKVDLQNISLNIFQLILKTLYTGCELLTTDNVLEVWSAVHQLQIHFLIKHCEDFVVKNLSVENLEMYRNQAEFLQFTRFSEIVFPFMLENFMSFRNTEAFLQLDFEDILKLVESEHLVVSSEDDVLFSIYDWVSYEDPTASNVQASDGSDETNNFLTVANEADAKVNSENDFNDGAKKREESQPVLGQSNERTKHLLQLVKATRYFLVSEACINTLLTNRLTRSNSQVEHIWREASVFKNSNTQNRFWPNAAIHRESSPFENVGIMCGCIFKVYSFQRNMWLYTPNLGYFSEAKYIDVNGQFYCCFNGTNRKGVYHFCNNNWVNVLFSPNEVKLFLSHDRFIYMFNSDNKKIERFRPHSHGATCRHRRSTIVTESFYHAINNAQYAISFERSILVFESVGNNDLAIVHCWDTEQNIWTRLTDLDFSADNMASFSNELFTYIIDESGRLYKVERLETIQFTFIKKIWDFQALLKGSVLFKDTLYVCGEFPDYGKYIPEIKSIYSSLEFLDMAYGGTSFVPFIISKSLIK